MPYNIPPERRIGDGWCVSGSRPCGPPSEILNSGTNLVRAPGGTSGYFSVSKKICVGECFFQGLTDDTVYNYNDKKIANPCPQVRDFDFTVLSSTSTGIPPTKDQYRSSVTESSSHIIKLVDKEYHQRNCVERAASGKTVGNYQGAVLYTTNCLTDQGDTPEPAPAGTPQPWSTEGPFPKKYLKKCASYDLNINPNGQAFKANHKCCSPKTSGPFKLETSYKNYVLEKETSSSPELVQEKLYDAPNLNTLFANIPEINLFNDNTVYMLTKRMHCDCTTMANCQCPCI